MKTDSEAGSEQQLIMYLYSSQGGFSGGINIYFTSTLQYFVHYCDSYRSRSNFPISLPDSQDKVWRINKTRTSEVIRLQVHCNDKEVLDILLSDKTCNDTRWRKYWNRNVEKVYFTHFDTASDFYRPYTKAEGKLT